MRFLREGLEHRPRRSKKRPGFGRLFFRMERKRKCAKPDPKGHAQYKKLRKNPLVFYLKKINGKSH